MKVLAVIPTYNECDNVGPMVEKLLALPLDLAIMFVDDESPDGTAERVGEIATEHPDKSIEVIVRAGRPRGLGNAYKDGFAEAASRDVDAVLQMDADGQHPTEAVMRMVEAIEQGVDLAIGSRYVEGGGTGDWNLFRVAISTVGGFGSRLLLRMPYRDLTGGFKVWRRELLAAIDWPGITCSGFAFQIETTLNAHRMGAKIVEVPFTFGLRERGDSKMSLKITVEGAYRLLRWGLLPPRVKKWERQTAGLNDQVTER